MKKMSKSKKTTILLAVLLIALGVFAFLDKEISMFEYGCLWINAMLWLGLVYSSEFLIESYEELIVLQEFLVCAQKAENKTLSELVNLLEKKDGKHDSGTAD